MRCGGSLHDMLQVLQLIVLLDTHKHCLDTARKLAEVNLYNSMDIRIADVHVPSWSCLKLWVLL